MIGVTGYGAYIPRLRMQRRAIADANAWYAPGLAGKAKGTKALANWDEDSITMAVAAARDCLGPAEDRTAVQGVFFASTTLPFAERLNAAVICEALTLPESTQAMEVASSQRAGLTALTQAVSRVRGDGGAVLVLAADARQVRPASTQELDYGDGAAAVLVGTQDVVAEHLASATLTTDFIDRFRASGEDIDYAWEERWVRDEGYGKLMPRAVVTALAKAEVAAADVAHFLMPSTFRGVDAQVAKACGIRADAVADALLDRTGDTGAGHPLLMLAHVLEYARPGAVIVLSQFGSGAEVVVLRATEAVRRFRPVKGVGEWLARGVEETSYTKFLSFKGQIDLDRGVRGEQDRKTALSTAYRHRSAILGLVAGRCSVTGQVSFPPSRLSYDRITEGEGKPLQDTQEPYKLAERRATVLSWSAEFLSFHRSPPHTYGQVDFEGGGRILMEFTDVAAGEIDSGTTVETTFRIKDIDERRGFTRYFWKATPVRAAATPAE